MEVVETHETRRRVTARLALLVLVIILGGIGADGWPFSGSGKMNGFELGSASIPVDEIRRGGPPRDGIPSIDDPKFISVEEADDFLRDDELVLTIERDGDARAYPRRILEQHEIVNDSVAGDPLAITYCPLCGTGMVFARELKGRVFQFGVSGLLYNSDVLMYDRQTESLWSQLAAESVSGEMVGTPLSWLPSRMLRWGSWKLQHPDGRVLSRDTGHRRNYARKPYANYYRSQRTMFPVDRHREDLETKEWVYGVVVNGQAKAYRRRALPGGRRVSDTVGGQKVLIRFDPESLELEVKNAESGEEIPNTPAYWFAWQAFHPETEVFGAEVEEGS